MRPIKWLPVASLLFATHSFAETIDFNVLVESTKQPIAKADVKLWKAVPNQNPIIMAKAHSSKDGRAMFTGLPKLKDGFYYVVAEGGVLDGNNLDAYQAMSAINPQQSGNVVVNELTTIGSVWPLAAQMIKKGGITGTKSGLLLGFSHVQNLTNVSTGDYGDTVLNGANVTFSETVGRMNVLASLMATCGAYQKQKTCAMFLDEVEASDTLEAMKNIATKPYAHPSALFDLFKSDFPYAKGEGVRPTSFLPYLEWEPKDFALMVRITGGGIYSPGRMMFDNRGQLWSGQNWAPGGQANLESAIGGGVSRVDVSGKAISPRLTGYNRQGLDGIGWGTTVTEDKVWVSSFNAKVGVLDLDGNVLGPATINGKYGALQGIATAPNGDIWIADNQYDQLLYFPKGNHTQGQVVKVPGLKRPFAVAVDNTNHVWVTNNGYVTVTRFPAAQPEKAQQISLGAMAPRGLAIDSTGHVWVGNNFSMGYPLAKVPEGANIIEEFKLNIEKVLENEKKGINKTGNLTLIAPDGKVIKKGLLEGTVYAMWGVSIDGADTVFAGNFLGTGFVQVCGTDESVCPKGKSTGDLIHLYQSGILQESTDVMIDDAGNVWMANNWDYIPALLDANPDRRTATRGGGTGIVVIYGIASPVINPLVGQIRRPSM